MVDRTDSPAQQIRQGDPILNVAEVMHNGKVV